MAVTVAMTAATMLRSAAMRAMVKAKLAAVALATGGERGEDGDYDAEEPYQ